MQEITGVFSVLLSQLLVYNEFNIGAKHSKTSNTCFRICCGTLVYQITRSAIGFVVAFFGCLSYCPTGNYWHLHSAFSTRFV